MGVVFAQMVTAWFLPVFLCADMGYEDGSFECDNYRADLADELWEDGVQFSTFWAVILFGTMAGNTIMYYGFGLARYVVVDG